MPNSECCDESENVVRAVLEAHWDAHYGRATSQLFRGRNTSVSRLSVTALPRTWQVMRAMFREKLLMLGEINVGKLAEIGRSHENPVHLTVVKSPSAKNAAHADIPQDITPSLSKRIISHLAFHSESGTI